MNFSPTWAVVRECGLMLILLHLSCIDIQKKKIPNTDLQAAVIWRILWLLKGESLASISESLLYGLLLAAAIYFVTGIYHSIRHRKGLGGGDIKLIVVLCLYLQGDQCLHMLLCACFFTLLTCRRDQFAFGPYLCVGWAIAKLLF